MNLELRILNQQPFSVIIVNIYSLLTSVIIAIVILACRDVLSYAFTDGEKVAATVSDLCPLLAITLVLNGIQPVLSGVAVGCGWQTFVAKVNVGCYYIIGIPLGALFGFHFKFDAKGLWTGMICASFFHYGKLCTNSLVHLQCFPVESV